MTAASENTGVTVGRGAEGDEEAKLQVLKGKLAVSLLACSSYQLCVLARAAVCCDVVTFICLRSQQCRPVCSCVALLHTKLHSKISHFYVL